MDNLLFTHFAIVGEHSVATWIDNLPHKDILGSIVVRSEERRVGKECRSRWSPYH